MTNKPKKMTEEEIGALVLERARLAMNSDDSELSSIRQEYLGLYDGEDLEGDGTEEMKGRSKYKTREVLEGIEDILVSVFRMFMQHPKPVEWLGVGPEDQKLAEQETLLVNHVVLQDCFLELAMIFKQAFLGPVAYGRDRVCHRDHEEVEEFEGLSVLDLEAIEAQDDVVAIEVLNTTSKLIDPLDTLPSAQHDRRAMEAAGQPVMPVTQIEYFDVRVRRQIERTDVKIEGVPPEEMLVDPKLTSLDLDEADFVAQRCRMSVSDLVEEGYDYEDLMEYAEDEDPDQTGEKVDRMDTADEDPDYFRRVEEPSNPYVEVTEAYIKADYDGDGVAELRKVIMVGNKVFENERVPDHPFVAFCAIPMPFRHVGKCYAELLKDIQLLSTVLTRQMLDSIYGVNRDRLYVNRYALQSTGGLETLQNRQSRIVEVDGDPNQAVREERKQSMAAEILPVLAALDTRKRQRTGVSTDISLDPEVLKRTTASAHAGAMDDRSGRIEMVVRTLAETGYKKLIQKVHTKLKRHSKAEMVRRIRGQYIQSNPLKWGMRYDLSVNVGIGYSSRQQTLDALMQYMAIMEKFAALNINIVEPRHGYAVFKRMVDTAGVGFVEEFAVDPTSPEWQPPQPQPDPNMLLAQASMVEAQGKSESEKVRFQTERFKIETQAQQNQANLEADRQKIAVELQLKMQQAQLETERVRLEHDMKMRTLQVEVATAKMQLAETLAKIRVANATADKTDIENSDLVRDTMAALDEVEQALEDSDAIGRSSEVAQEEDKAATGAS